LRKEGFKYQSHWKQRGRLLSDTGFVAKTATSSFEHKEDTCEASALTTEPTAPD
jgi:hypothetical protein